LGLDSETGLASSGLFIASVVEKNVYWTKDAEWNSGPVVAAGNWTECFPHPGKLVLR